VFLLAFAAGCENASTKSPLESEVSALREEKIQLTRQLTESKTQNEQLKKRLHVLSGLGEGVKAERLYRLERIKIGGYTNLYDKDKDGSKEKLIVYIQPFLTRMVT
jgi:septal ring factor EnvC (AmiA/AmiB activator)